VRRAPATSAEAAAGDVVRRLVYSFRPGMRTVTCCPLYHSAPNLYTARSLAFADLIILQPRFEPEALLQVIASERITHLFLTPTNFVRLLKLPKEQRLRHDVSSLEAVIHAAAPCPPAVKRAMIEWFGPVINEFYGGTESGPVTFCSSAEWLARPGTVGRPVPGATIRAYGDDGTLLETGEPGELFMRLSSYPDFTYHGQPAARREIERDGLITCGDIGYFDAEGYLFICDRKRDMVISGGVNIYPAEIESVLVTMPGLHDAVVFGIPDEEFGEALMALVEPMPGSILEPEAVKAFLRGHLADYKVPRRVEMRDALPREDTGKIFKRKLRAPYWTAAGRGGLTARDEGLMAIPKAFAGHLSLPVVGAPMFIVSSPALVIAQCQAGILGCFPSLNARPEEELPRWIGEIRGALDAYRARHPKAPVAPFGVNLIVNRANQRLARMTRRSASARRCRSSSRACRRRAISSPPPMAMAGWSSTTSPPCATRRKRRSMGSTG
ncbi:MAG TPA: AMP-binding protein, partial [Dongiaceae bacterium]